MEIRITGIGSDMQGVGRAEDGRAVFVPGALPGESVSAGIIQRKDRFLRARLEKVLEESPHRVSPPCPCAGQCGGCPAMHMRYEYSLEIKRQRVEDALLHLGAARAKVMPVIGMPDPFRARNKAEYAIEGGRIGLRRGESRELIEVEDCLIQARDSVRAMLATREWLKTAPGFSGYLVTRVTRAGEMMAILSLDRNIGSLDVWAQRLRAEVPGIRSLYECRLNARPNHALNGSCRLIWGERALTEELMGLKFRLQPQTFFQVNPAQAERLYGEAVALSDLTGREKVLDAYCGAGAITLCMARKARLAVGVEIVLPAVEDARENARLNGLGDRAKFVCADAAEELPRLLAKGAPPDVVVVDPPRKGVDEKLIRAVLRAKAPRVVYLSCDPATLARDVKRLAEGYHLQEARPVDMFPWSSHVETAALLRYGKQA